MGREVEYFIQGAPEAVNKLNVLVDGIDDNIDIGVACNQNPNDFRINPGDLFQQLDAVHLGHALIGKDNLERFGFQYL